MAYINSSKLNGKYFEPSAMKEVNLNEEKLYYVRSTDNAMEYIAKVKCTPIFIKERTVGSQVWKDIEQNETNNDEMPELENGYIPPGLENTYMAQMAPAYKFYEMPENVGGKRNKRKTVHKKKTRRAKKSIRRTKH
jgi:hypothetical protein